MEQNRLKREWMAKQEQKQQEQARQDRAERERIKQQLPYAHFFQKTPGIGKRDMEALRIHFGDYRTAYEAKREEIGALLGEEKAIVFQLAKNKGDAMEDYEEMCKKGISFVYRQCPDYPAKLQYIPDPPFGLYYMGSLPGEGQKSVAVIGARNCSQYGAHVAAQLGRELALAGVQVISGMAKGIDGISQQAALQAGGRSYGVLGSGVDVCYPPSNKRLYRQLQEAGGVLSEYPPGAQPMAERFPPRNRIISGLADVLVVVEAKQKSGTLITVDMALEQGREIYCVPGRVTDALSEGCNRLISQGAGILFSVEEFLEKSGLWNRVVQGQPGLQGGENFRDFAQSPAEKNALRKLGQKEYALWKLLDFDPVSVEQLYIQLVAQKDMEQVTLQEVMEMLTGLVILDLAENVSGFYYAKKG